MIKVDCLINRISPDDGFHYFFGYYDKNPWDSEEEKILAHRTTFCHVFPDNGEAVEVGYICLKSKAFIRIGESYSWNWQQGTQLQWISKSKVLYNAFSLEGTERYIEYDIESCTQQVYDGSFYTTGKNGRIKLTLNYGRLYKERKDYGYAVCAQSIHDHNYQNDGIFKVDNGRKELILSLEDVINFEKNALGANSEHWVNHIMINPSGSRFCFLHRFNRPDNIVYSRLMTCNIHGKDLRIIFEGMVSHYDWIDNDSLVAWAGARNLLGNNETGKRGLSHVVKKSLKGVYYFLGKPRILMQYFLGDSYFIINDTTSVNNSIPFAKGKLTVDGHCTISRNKSWMLTDGYPDRNSKQPLYLYNLRDNSNYLIGRFYTPKELDNEIRVDLHPRFNSKNTEVLIDSALSGKRAMYSIDIQNIIY